jgi:hypothetical protein
VALWSAFFYRPGNPEPVLAEIDHRDDAEADPSDVLGDILDDVDFHLDLGGGPFVVVVVDAGEGTPVWFNLDLVNGEPRWSSTDRPDFVGPPTAAPPQARVWLVGSHAVRAPTAAEALVRAGAQVEVPPGTEAREASADDVFELFESAWAGERSADLEVDRLNFKLELLESHPVRNLGAGVLADFSAAEVRALRGVESGVVHGSPKALYALDARGMIRRGSDCSARLSPLGLLAAAAVKVDRAPPTATPPTAEAGPMHALGALVLGELTDAASVALRGPLRPVTELSAPAQVGVPADAMAVQCTFPIGNELRQLRLAKAFGGLDDGWTVLTPLGRAVRAALEAGP